MLHLDRQLRRASLTLFSIILFLGPKVEAALPDLVSLIRSGSGGRIVGSDAADTGVLKLERRWRRDVCELRLKNPGASPVRVHEVVLVDVAHGLRGDTPVYAEGFQMLSQTAGTLAEPRDVGGYTHRGHYRLPEPPGFRAVYGMMMVSPPDSDRILTGFTSCRRFNGKLHFNGERLQVVVETEDLELGPGQSWRLEDLLLALRRSANAR